MNNPSLLPYFEALCAAEYVHTSTLDDIFSRTFDDPLNLNRVHSEYNSIIDRLKKNKWVINTESDIFQITPAGLKKAQDLGIHPTAFHPSFKDSLPVKDKPVVVNPIKKKEVIGEKLYVLLYPIELSEDEMIITENLSCYGYVDLESEICNNCEVQGACYQATFSLILSKNYK